MKKVNRKRLNNKGFTLIELLAVVVILAIVMGITGTAVLNSINNSRKSTLYSAAQNAANTLNTWISEDMLVTIDAQKKLGDKFIANTQTTNLDKWVCLASLKIRNADGKTTDPTVDLYKALGFSNNDIVLGTTWSKETASADPKCSALRYNKSIGGYEIVLVANSGGKFYVSSDSFHYAYSRATGPNQANID